MKASVIQSLEDYVYILGMCTVSIKSLVEIQHTASISTYLQDDEREQVLAIKHSLLQAFAGVRVLLEMIGEHTTINIDETQARLQTRMRDDVSTNSVSNDNSNDNSIKLVKKRGRPKKVA